MKGLRVTKGAQALFLGVYTALVLGGTLFIQGGATVRTNLVPFEDVVRFSQAAERTGFLSSRPLLILAGIAGNIFMFAVWGFLAWKFLNGRGRSATLVHLDVVFVGVLLSVGIETVQLFLPTRAADVNDVFWNSIGALVGSLASHVHATVRIEWE